ncbi:hypothetical protein HOH51_00105 [bacterium]|jgi:hypothetical protein|nr:hypothetical protein [bacterium]
MTTSKIVREIVQNDYVLSFGLQNRILNLTQVARLMRPSVKSALHKDVSIDSIVMALSRMQDDMVEFAVPNKLKIDQFVIKKDLALISLQKSKKNLQKILKLKLYALQNDKFYSVSESMNEISLMIHESLVDLFESYKLDGVNFVQNNIAALMIKIPKEYLELTGMFQYFVQRLTLHSVNILEISSTYTELIFYVHEDGVSDVINLF